MKRFLFYLILTSSILSCSSPINKSITEDLSDKELSKLLKNEMFSAMYYYCFDPAKGRNSISDLPQLRRAELYNVTYKSFSEYFYFLDDLRNKKDSSIISFLYEKRYGTEDRIIKQLDSVKERWYDYLKFADMYDEDIEEQKFIPQSIRNKYIILKRQNSIIWPNSWKSEKRSFTDVSRCNFEIIKECILPNIETFNDYFCYTYIFEDSWLAKTWPKESMLFTYLIDINKSPYYWNWANIFYEIEEPHLFPPTWTKIQDAFKMELDPIYN